MRTRVTWTAAAFAFVSLATAALGQGRSGHPIVLAPVAQRTPVALSTPTPLPVLAMPTFAPASQALKRRYVGKVPPGTRVPFSRLPTMPRKTAFNTIVPGRGHHGGRFRPMAATGATIGLTAAAACSTGGTVGNLFNVGCQLTIKAANLSAWSSTDGYQDYVVPPDAVTATALCAAYTGNADPGCSETLSEQGTYQFLVYDTTAKVFAAAVFVNAGQVFTIAVYQDPFHTSETNQFDTGTSTAAYIYLQNVAPSDHYVVYVESTGVNAYCAYMAPAATPSPPTPRPSGAPSSLLCNPSNVTGVQAPGGSLSLTWALTPSLEAGSYSVVVYDQDANSGAGQTLGQAQVSLTSGGAAILTHGATPAPNPSAGPNEANPPSETTLSWDGSTDQSVDGISGTTQQIVSPSTYRWTISDPDGQVVATSAPVTISGNQAVGPQTFAFSSIAAMQTPGQYPASTWVMELYDTINKKVEASQAFSIVGYHVTTQANVNGTYGSELNFNCGNGCGSTGVLTLGPGASYGLKFTNDSNVVFGGSGDSISEIEYSTGSDATTGACGTYSLCITPSNTTGNGNMLRLADAACHNAFTCTSGVTATDSSGNAWNVQDYCSATTSGGLHSQCDLLLTPVDAGTVLPPGGSIEVDDIEFYYVQTQGGNNGVCDAAACASLTSELPSHGLAWSAVNNIASPTAWTPITWGSISGGSVSTTGTVNFKYVGSINSGFSSGKNILAASGTTPWTNGHFYQSFYQQADYQNSTPFAPGTGRYSIAAFTITNNNSDNYAIHNTTGQPTIAIGLPGYFSTSQIQFDTTDSPSNWEQVSCPTSFGTQYVCLAVSKNSNSGIAAGKSATFYFYVPLSVSSFSFQEISAQAYSDNGLVSTWYPLTKDSSTSTTVDGEWTGLDSLAIGDYSLNSGLISAAFTPPTIGSGQNPTPLTVVVTNTSSGADPFPDSIDTIVIEQSTSKTWTQATPAPALTSPRGGWSYLATFNPSGNTMDYWYGLCAGQAVEGDGPPETRSVAVPLTSQYPVVKPLPCATPESGALRAGESVTIPMNLNNFTGSGNVTFTMYAHGANGGGWSEPKQFTVSVSSESASAGFASIGSTCPGTAIATNTLPTIAGSPNCYVYSLKNTSASAAIGTVDITLPAYDINGLAAGSGGTDGWTLVGSPITQNIKVGTISGGTFTTSGAPAGCTVNSAATVDPVPGTSNGKIEISGCTGFTAGKTLAVEFQSNSPASQSDTYDFPATLDPAGANVSAGETWIGDQSVQVQFSVGLTVVVDPSNPGPGGSTPVVDCSQCAFSGTTIDFGAIANNGKVTGGDVVRAGVVYTGATQSGHSWSLSIQANGNPTCSGASCASTNEMLTSIDTGTSGNKCGQTITVPAAVTQPAYAVIPTATSQTLATGPEYQCSTPYEIIQDLEISIGTESNIGHVETLTYTLVAN